MLEGKPGFCEPVSETPKTNTNKPAKLTLLNFKTYFKTVSNQNYMGRTQTDKDKWNRCPQIKPLRCGQMILDKCAKTIK